MGEGRLEGTSHKPKENFPNKGRFFRLSAVVLSAVGRVILCVARAQRKYSNYKPKTRQESIVFNVIRAFALKEAGRTRALPANSIDGRIPNTVLKPSVPHISPS
ncbi:hypothetical protein CC2G_011231 [Coprinopsis cinerea AmutBmut pab1-1]|nr:hypothetical protein CC2G_011231 [Coprinopsis cinerea AmutBmut pab1-1]